MGFIRKLLTGNLDPLLDSTFTLLGNKLEHKEGSTLILLGKTLNLRRVLL